MSSSGSDGNNEEENASEPLAQRSQALYDEHEDNAIWLSEPTLNLQTMPQDFPQSALRLFNLFTGFTATAQQQLLDRFAERQADSIAHHACITMLNAKLTATVADQARRWAIILACFEVRSAALCQHPLDHSVSVSTLPLISHVDSCVNTVVFCR